MDVLRHKANDWADQFHVRIWKREFQSPPAHHLEGLCAGHRNRDWLLTGPAFRDIMFVRRLARKGLNTMRQRGDNPMPAIGAFWGMGVLNAWHEKGNQIEGLANFSDYCYDILQSSDDEPSVNPAKVPGLIRDSA